MQVSTGDQKHCWCSLCCSKEEEEEHSPSVEERLGLKAAVFGDKDVGQELGG